MTRSERSNKGRLGSKKSTTGCITCKIRKIKCDETKPACARCSTTGRKCDGYAASNASSQLLTLRASPGSYSNTSPDELRSFQFFTEHVAPICSHIVNKVFWRITIPQLSQADVVVWDAVIAMSQLAQYPQHAYVYDTSIVCEHNKPPVSNPYHVKALKSYNKSVGTLRERLSSGQIPSVVARVSCIMYICIECLQNNIEGAINLHQQAMALARAAPTQPSLECDFDLEETLGAMMRHMSVSQSLPMLERGRITTHASDAFSSLSQAREELYFLIKDAHAFCCNIEEIKMKHGKDWTASPAQRGLSKQIHTRFTAWMSNLNSIPDFSLAYLPERETELCSVLLLAYSHFSIWLSACLSTFETAYDCFFSTFKSMVEHAERVTRTSGSATRPVFVFEARIIPTMFFVATRCRFPTIRRAAIKVLRGGPQIENTWRADSMAQVAELNVAIEESGSVDGIFYPEPQIVELPPEGHRIFRQKAVELVDELGRPAHYLKFARWQQDVDMNWVQKEDIVKLSP